MSNPFCLISFKVFLSPFKGLKTLPIFFSFNKLSEWRYWDLFFLTLLIATIFTMKSHFCSQRIVLDSNLLYSLKINTTKVHLIFYIFKLNSLFSLFLVLYFVLILICSKFLSNIFSKTFRVVIIQLLRHIISHRTFFHISFHIFFFAKKYLLPSFTFIRGYFLILITL